MRGAYERDGQGAFILLEEDGEENAGKSEGVEGEETDASMFCDETGDFENGHTKREEYESGIRPMKPVWN